MTTTRRLTKITRSDVQTLRGVIQRAIDEATKPYGLKATLGNITFEPTGFRTKLNAVVVDVAAPTVTEVKAGQVWLYGAKTYTVDSVMGDNVTARRRSRSRSAILFGGGYATYRINRVKLLAGGTLVSGG